MNILFIILGASIAFNLVQTIVWLMTAQQLLQYKKLVDTIKEIAISSDDEDLEREIIEIFNKLSSPET